jgi:hypothetical protein
MVPTENTLVPSNLVPDEAQIKFRLLKSDQLYEYFCGTTNNGNSSTHYEKVSQLYNAAKQNIDACDKEDMDTFISRVGRRHPDKLNELNLLRPQILRKILKGDKLDDDYYERLKK